MGDPNPLKIWIIVKVCFSDLTPLLYLPPFSIASVAPKAIGKLLKSEKLMIGMDNRIIK